MSYPDYDDGCPPEYEPDYDWDSDYDDEFDNTIYDRITGPFWALIECIKSTIMGK